METFFENREFIVRHKSSSVGIENNVRENNTRVRHVTFGPLPLEIEDVLRIKIDCDQSEMWRSLQSIYGRNFKTVMFYGRCKAFRGNVRSEPGRNVRQYEVDDGSGMIIVHFAHSDRKYFGMIVLII